MGALGLGDQDRVGLCRTTRQAHDTAMLDPTVPVEPSAPRPDRFPLVVLLVLLLGMAGAIIGLSVTLPRLAREQAAVDAIDQARFFLQGSLHPAQLLYRAQRVEPRDERGLGAFGDLPALIAEGLIEAEAFDEIDGEAARRGPYWYRVLLPHDPAEAATWMLVLALPEEQALPALAIDVDGQIRMAPGAEAAGDPRLWPILPRGR